MEVPLTVLVSMVKVVTHSKKLSKADLESAIVQSAKLLGAESSELPELIEAVNSQIGTIEGEL